MNELVDMIMDNIKERIYAPDETHWNGAVAVNIEQLGGHRKVLCVLGDTFISEFGTNVSEDMIEYNSPQIMIYHEQQWKIKLECYTMLDDVGDVVYDV